MRTRLGVAVVAFLMLGTPVGAHRLDEYLQAATISIEKHRVQTQLRLTPGVAVVSRVLASIDTDADGAISYVEQQVYVERVLGDLSLKIDGERLSLRLISAKFPPIQAFEEGRGEIQLEVEADVPGGGPDRRLTLENQHQTSIAAYLVNCLVPRDLNIRVTAQSRNYMQSFYQLDYVQIDPRSVSESSTLLSRFLPWFGITALFVVAGIAYVWQRRH